MIVGEMRHTANQRRGVSSQVTASECNDEDADQIDETGDAALWRASLPPSLRWLADAERATGFLLMTNPCYRRLVEVMPMRAELPTETETAEMMHPWMSHLRRQPVALPLRPL